MTSFSLFTVTLQQITCDGTGDSTTQAVGEALAGEIAGESDADTHVSSPRDQDDASGTDVDDKEGQQVTSEPPADSSSPLSGDSVTECVEEGCPAGTPADVTAVGPASGIGDGRSSKEATVLEPTEGNDLASISVVPSSNDLRQDDETVSDEAETDYVSPYSKTKLLGEVLKRFKIRNSTWVKSIDMVTTTVSFVVESGRRAEDVLDALVTCGIGKEPGTLVSISPLTVCLSGEWDRVKSKKLVNAKPAESVEETTSQEKPVSMDDQPAEVALAVEPMKPISRNVTSTSLTAVSSRVTFEPTAEALEIEGLLSEPSVDGGVDTESVQGSEFRKSIKSRIILQPIVTSLKRNAEFTFDYLVFIILASIISAVGLIENNSVILVASMLISPLMGPILALTFGAAVQDSVLMNTGIKSEIIGLLICIVTGFVLGLPVMFLMASGGSWKPSTDSWPSLEMYGRGLPRSLATGAVIAFVSGLAVALSVLSDNQGSLVGVAISASLLPPAVNSGLLWAYSFQAAVVGPTYQEPPSPFVLISNSTNDTQDGGGKPWFGSSLACPGLPNNTYILYFSCDMAQETFLLGLISLLLTVVNILLIVAAAMLCLKIKQVSPRASVHNEQMFWTKHLKVAKDYNTTVRPSTNAWETLVTELKSELQITDKEAQRIVYDRQFSYRAYRLDMPNDLLGVSDEGEGNFARLQRAQSLNERKPPNELLRLMSHQSKLESMEFQERESRTEGRFKIIKD